ncbi:MAG: AAA family ATPase [Chitinophagaceae bacterium]
MDVRKIVILGPESTGKSVLSQQLADHFNTLWCPEFAREYLTEFGSSYTYDDLLVIARNQVRTEDEHLELVRKKQTDPSGLNTDTTNQLSVGNAGPLLFIDTNMYVMKVWCEYVFNNCHRYILDQIIERPYDLYLLCNTDLPWVKDDLREYPDPENRQRLYSIYKDLMINQSVPWVEIAGDYSQRLPTAIRAVNDLLRSSLF